MNFRETSVGVFHPDPAALAVKVQGTDHTLTVEEARKLRDLLDEWLPKAVALNEAHHHPQDAVRRRWWRR